VQGVPIAAVALKRPPAVTEPHFALQVTGAEALNCCVDPSGVVAETGVMMIGDTRVTLAFALPLPSFAVAVTTQVVLGYSGALNSPEEEMLPQVVFHVDGRLAVNCLVAFSSTVALVGTTVTARAVKDVRIRKMKESVRAEGRLMADLRAANVGLHTLACEIGENAASHNFGKKRSESRTIKQLEHPGS